MNIGQSEGVNLSMYVFELQFDSVFLFRRLKLQNAPFVRTLRNEKYNKLCEADRDSRLMAGANWRF